MRAVLGRRWQKTLKRRIEGYQLEVGILSDKPHREAIEQLGSYAGGPVRKAKGKSGNSVGDVLVANMERLNIDLLRRPFDDKNSDILRFTNAFLKFAMTNGKVGLKRVENLLQAIVRNPILKQEYGHNKSATADAKGFDRHLIDTGQMFKGIRARAKRVRK